MNNLVRLILFYAALEAIDWNNIPIETKQIIIVEPLNLEDLAVILTLGIEEIDLHFVKLSALLDEMNSNYRTK